MQSEELAEINAQIRAVAGRIQPLLEPHPGLQHRNAHAHVWLGLKLVFGNDWRERVMPASVRAFLSWMESNPNADYGAYDGPRDELSAEARGALW